MAGIANDAAAVLGDLDQFERIVSHLVNGLQSESPVLDKQDIRQDAYLGLCEAAVRWKPDQNVQLKTYAYLRIRGNAFDAIRRVNGTRKRWRPFVHSMADESVRLAAANVRAEEQNPDEHLDYELLLHASVAEIVRMPRPHRDVMVAMVKGSGRLREVAAELGMGVTRASELYLEGSEWLRNRLTARGVLDV